MANEKMQDALELKRYKNLLSEQIQKLIKILNSVDTDETREVYDQLDIMIEFLKKAFSTFISFDENILLDHQFFNQLNITYRAIYILENEVNGFLKIYKNSEEVYLKNDQYISKIFEVENKIYDLLESLEYLKSQIETKLRFDEENNVNEKINEKVKILEGSLDDVKNIEVHNIFVDDEEKFKTSAIRYEIAFYFVIFFAALYFLGLTFYVTAFESKILSISFPEKIHGNLSTEFYIQKISFLILSTTLAAFLLKRSFMNRRLADEANRTAKELDALPRYMAGMSEELKEKIRFDLAYKYFGNNVHHESYTSGENLVHENIKANTEFLKSVKSADVGKGKSNEG